MASLKDQFLKAGLIDKSKADKIAQDERKKAHQNTTKAKKRGEHEVDEAKLLAERIRQEQAERSRELNRQQREQAEQKAIQAQIKQLIDMNRLERKKGQVSYQFADQNKIKNMYVTDEQQQQLARGIVAVVRFGDGYELVQRAVAEKIAQRDADCVLVLNLKSEQSAPEDDPYAAFQVPDDLMW